MKAKGGQRCCFVRFVVLFERLFLIKSHLVGWGDFIFSFTKQNLASDNGVLNPLHFVQAQIKNC